MKRYIKSSGEITNNYLDELFKKIDWDDNMNLKYYCKFNGGVT